MFKKRLFTVFVFILAMALLVSGCGSNKSASEMLQEAFIKTNEIKSASFDGIVDLNFEQSGELQSIMTFDEQMVFNILKNATLSYKGSYQLDPFQAEVILTAALPFEGIEMKFEVPILMNSEKLWFKIPSIPGLDFGEFSGSFLEMDLKQLAEESGETLPFSTETMQLLMQLSNETYGVFFKHFDESYFKNVDVPSGVNAKNAVEFTITQDQLKNVITLFVEKVMPDLLDILAKPEYDALTGGVTAEMLAQAKEELTVSPDELDETINEISQICNNLTMTNVMGIDKNGYISYQSMDISGKMTNPNEPGSLSFTITFTQNLTKINETVTFENHFPPENVIPFNDLMYMGMGAFDDFGDFDYDYDYDYDYSYDEDFDYDYELLSLYEQMFNQDWFINNEEIINELYELDYDFAMNMEDPEFVALLINDPAFRAEFFANYGIELVE